MIELSENGEIASDEVALAFMFAVHSSVDGDEGLFGIPQPRRHHLIERAINQIVAQFEADLALPLVRGKFHGRGATVIYLDKPDFRQHAKLYDPNSFGVLEIHFDKKTESGEMIYSGFDAYVRLGGSNTWLCIGIKPPDSEDGDSYDDGDNDFLDEDISQEKIDWKAINVVAVAVARAPGFGSVVRSPDIRGDFARPLVEELMPDADPDMVAHQAVTFWELGVIPQRAKKLKADGKKISEIAKLLGITRQRAERAVDMDDKQVASFMAEHGEE